MRSSGNELYRLVQRAREACAGDAVKMREVVVRMINEAFDYAFQYDAHVNVLDKLNEAKDIMKTVVDYADRLPADRILCGLLNNELKGFG